MLERRWLGDKTGQGFYKKEKDARRQRGPPRARLANRRIPSRNAAQISFAGTGQERRIAARASAHAHGRQTRAKDKAAAFQWQLLSRLFAYAASCLPEIADDPASIDRAMRTGFNWEFGPFEMWDAVGVEATLARMRPVEVPNAEKLLRSGGTSWYRGEPAGKHGL